MVVAARAASAAAAMAAKRSAMGMSPAGTSMRASEKAFAPDDALRVLTAIEARRVSTGAPSSR